MFKNTEIGDDFIHCCLQQFLLHVETTHNTVSHKTQQSTISGLVFGAKRSSGTGRKGVQRLVGM